MSLLSLKTLLKFLDEDLPLTLKHLSVNTAGDGRHSGHLTLSQTSVIHKLEDLEEETEEATSRKNTAIENTSAAAKHSSVNNGRSRNDEVQIRDVDTLSQTVTRRRSVSSNDVNSGDIQITVRRQKSYPQLNLGNKSSLK